MEAVGEEAEGVATLDEVSEPTGEGLLEEGADIARDEGQRGRAPAMNYERLKDSAVDLLFDQLDITKRDGRGGRGKERMNAAFL